MSCSRLFNEYDGLEHNYEQKRGLIFQKIFLTGNAPSSWQNRETLWNAVETAEKTKDSRLAREFIVALPKELNADQWTALLTDFIQTQFVQLGMCADVSVHCPDPNNPHAHILTTVRPLDTNGQWQSKTQKEYLCVKDGEERGFTATEFQKMKSDGWEKQYQYLDGKQKIYLPPSAAADLERCSKHPKSTKFGRQNPITALWSSENQLQKWREAWADTVNRYLAQNGFDERIDHRSHAARGIDEQPTIHEGVAAKVMEKKGLVVETCEINRMIQADNALLRELKAAWAKINTAVEHTVTALAEKLEKLRQQMIILSYHLRHIQNGKEKIMKYLKDVKVVLVRVKELSQQIKDKMQKRKSLRLEKQNTSVFSVKKQKELVAKINTVTEDLEELKSERKMLWGRVNCDKVVDVAKVERRNKELEQKVRRLGENEGKYAQQLEDVKDEYERVDKEAKGVDRDELAKERLEMRNEMDMECLRMLKSDYKKQFRLKQLMDIKKSIIIYQRSNHKLNAKHYDNFEL